MQKTWTERRMLWLVDRFGIERLRAAEVVLPTKDYFPDPYRGTAKDCRRIFEQLCAYMDVNPQHVRLEVCRDYQLPTVAGHYDAEGQPVIRIGQSQLADLTNAIAILAHELAHDLLLGGGLLTAQVADHEWVTDLVPVFLGLGIFAANATIQEGYVDTALTSWWSIRRLGYLPVQVFGYALAVFAFLRDELEPAWAAYLRPDAAESLAKGLRFLTKSSDTLLHLDMEAMRRPPTTVDDWTARLESRSASVRLTALWDLCEQSRLDPALVEPVAACLEDKDPDIPPEAAHTLGAFGPAARSALPQLARALWGGLDLLRAGAAYAVGRAAPHSANLIPDLGALVKEDNWDVVYAVSGALRQFGRQAESTAPGVLHSLKRATLECNQQMIDDLAATLIAVSHDPERHVCETFRNDAEVRRRTLATLEELQRRASTRPTDEHKVKPGEPPQTPPGFRAGPSA